MHSIARTAVLVVLAACASSPAPATSPPADPPPPTPAPHVELAVLGGPCGDGQRCDAPATCVTYYGIAGPSGPAFKSCEVSCADRPDVCPGGTTCVTIADGPGAVCRHGDR